MDISAACAPVPATRLNRLNRLARHARLAALACVFGLGAMGALNAYAADNENYGTMGSASSGSDISGPVRLNSSRQAGSEGNNTQSANNNQQYDSRSKTRYVPGEFEIYVNKLLGIDLQLLEEQQKKERLSERTAVQSTSANNTNAANDGNPSPTKRINPDEVIRRLGSDLMLDDSPGSNSGADGPREAPPDYLIGIGDEVQVTMWGSVDADLRLTVDRSGRITIPRVGPVMVAGVRYGDLNDVVRGRAGQVFRNFQVSTSLGKLRTIRIYVTGFTAKPGAYTVSSLATVVTGLIRAGGPSAAGSFRQIELRRNGEVVAKFDAYDLLLKGDKTTDRALQAEDVIHIGPIGAQVAILGSVNKPSIAELKPNETVEDVLAMAGGFSAVADRSRVSVERLSERTDRRVVELQLPQQLQAGISNGDVMRVFSSVNTQLPQYKQYKRVQVEGEVARPGEYVLPPAATLSDAIQAAGGLTPQAFVFGTDFSRESVRLSQQENYDRALRDLETEFTRNTATQRAINADDAAAQAQRAAGSARLIERLRAVRPTGRIVLQLEPEAQVLPSLTVEDGDKLRIPPRPTTVGVFGSVFNAGSYLLNSGASVDDTLRLAGGPTRGADPSSIFVLRANGGVVSARQSSSGWLGFGSNLSSLPALPGDTVFVPEEMNKTTFIQEAKEWTTILYQFGLGAAALKTIRE
ncbi:protein involved in polysaccharide export, contains SLBB domain of the beta-grasp fold [Roseateles sp. YR242]|uniref:SLBB domain-containing protein n=1 Tax=Roseateles sp. YR242 TaxID=1855305 RepID=UPI0008C02568|nr:SLBB domain-containing protein [Roseateles sp. YR242]SEK56972.1 protein involved in polysaccharide export, contains SLBB domain of the beta-grasp fold [Roseateles sp. YR242]